MAARKTKWHFYKISSLSIACLASLTITAQDAQAQDLGQCLKDTVGCGVNIAKTQIDILTAATDVLAFTAQYPHCISDIAASNFITIGISSSMVGLAAAGVLKQEGGSYTNYIYGQASRPIVQAISSIVPVPALSNLLKENDDVLVSLFPSVASAIPIPSVGAPTLERQLDCGNAIATTGQAMVGKVKNFVGHAKGAVKSCSAAASCFAGVLVDIVKDPVGAVGSAGEFLVDGADTVLDAVFGGCKNLDSQVFFDANIKPWKNDIAYNVIWGGQPNAYNVKAEALVKNCVGYYKGCDSDSKDANRRCTVMSTGAKQEDGNGWIEGKGLEQLVRTRQMELRIPQFLATDMKWALAQPTSGKDTALINQQFDRLPVQLRPLVKEKFSFSFKSAREAATRKIMGFAPGYSGNGDFGGKDAKVVMADQSIGALMLAYVPAQGAENKSTNTKINDLYKQYIPNGNALLQQIEAATGESLGKAIAEVVKQNGDAWNDAFTNTQLQKMAKRMEDCKDAHKDAQKTCKKNIADALEFVYSALPAMGKANNYAGIGAMGIHEQAHKNYLKFIQDADNTVGKHVVYSALVMLGEKPIAATGISTTPSTAAAANLAAAPRAPDSGGGVLINNSGLAGVTPGVGGAVLGGKTVGPAGKPPEVTIKNDGPTVGRLNTGSVGMPGAPTMGVVAFNNKSNPPKQADLGAAASGKAPGAAVNSPASAPPAPVVVLQTANLEKVAPDVSKLPFDADTYRKVREKAIEAEWMPKCTNNAACLAQVNNITDKLLEAEIKALKAGTPDHTNQTAVIAFQNSLDPIYDPQFKEALPKIATYQPPSGQAITNNQSAPPKFVDKPLPFDASAYRNLRDKEIKAQWLPKCGGNSACLQRMSDITQSLVTREVTALSAGTPLHTDRVAVTNFQNSLDSIFDPQFKAAIPATATSTPATGGATLSNKKPSFKSPL